MRHVHVTPFTLIWVILTIHAILPHSVTHTKKYQSDASESLPQQAVIVNIYNTGDGNRG